MQAAIDAIRSQKCLEVRYDGYTRVVEVHACGYSKDGNPLMRVWQVAGGSQSNERTGWKLLRLDEAIGLALLDTPSNAPRRDYKKGDAAMSRLIEQV